MATTFATASLNGRFLHLDKIKIAGNDRGFLYGDGLFETVRVHSGRPFLWEWHMTRFMDSATVLGIPLGKIPGSIPGIARELIHRNGVPESILRITLTRGVGERGYGVTGKEQPTMLVTQHTMPPTPTKPLSLATTTARIAIGDPLGRVKSANKLGSILAKREATANGADDGLILNSDGNITETSSANIFWIENGVPHTPPVSDSVLPGVTRNLVIGLATALGTSVREESAEPGRLQQAEAVFVTSAVTGVVAVGQVDGTSLGTHPFVAQLLSAYEAALEKHTSNGD